MRYKMLLKPTRTLYTVLLASLLSLLIGQKSMANEQLQTAEKAQTEQQSITSISQQQLLERQQSGQPILLLDVRSEQEYILGHVPGAFNIPHSEIADNLAVLEPYQDKEVIVYCRSGRRAALAIEQLQQLGFSNVIHLEGDMNLWQQNNRPIEK
ncbi:rhodanese-like domain-containing protein [Thalassotalea ponticola]|uniref:rhodanese-like domain-containing protein n=1 Tax=Thalassotalea ponticola TaxID=1523392 RepID=UPI0025B2C2AD|nr:rhodanese-like domain-containing protein [Thalassotalea ponticola]MDN3653352.1 rhodanese-like domain-containing protein [Thalassotalea ponticola]